MLADKIKKLLMEIEEQKKIENSLRDSTLPYEKLLYCLCYAQPKTKEGWIELQKDVHQFMKSDSPEDQKKKVMQYTEMLAMIISGYETKQK